MLSVQVLTFRHPALVKDVFLPFRLIVFQPLLGAVLLHSLCWNTPSCASGPVTSAGVLDIAGGRGEVAFELHHVHKIPVVLLEPRLWSPYKLSRRQRAILKKDSINIDTFSIPQLQCTLDAQSWEQHRQVCSHTISVDISIGSTERLEYLICLIRMLGSCTRFQLSQQFAGVFWTY